MCSVRLSTAWYAASDTTADEYPDAVEYPNSDPDPDADMDTGWPDSDPDVDCACPDQHADPDSDENSDLAAAPNTRTD